MTSCFKANSHPGTKHDIYSTKHTTFSPIWSHRSDLVSYTRFQPYSEVLLRLFSDYPPTQLQLSPRIPYSVSVLPCPYHFLSSPLLPVFLSCSTLFLFSVS